jgi:NAD dependent epimerase/dehydratase
VVRDKMTESRATCLVTGAGGFIGSHLVERLVEDGWAVRALVRYISWGGAGFLDELDDDVRDSVEIVRGDLRDAECLRAATRGRDVVFHLGALIGIPYSYEAPDATAQVNVIGTQNVLDAARANDVSRIVHTSTSEVYGTARYVPMDESHPLQAQSPYAATKIAADKLAESYHLSFGLPVCTIRPFNTYGPRQSRRAVIPTIITQALAGDDVELGNLTPTRDFTFVTDTARAFALAAVSDDAVGRVVNLGTSTEISIAELCERVGAILGKTLSVRTRDERTRPARSEVDRLFSDNSLARDILRWEPAVDIDRGLRATCEWLREREISGGHAQYAV